MSNFLDLQREINNGSIWLDEGSGWCAARIALEDGNCILGRKSFRNYYGGYVPSRTEVKRGSLGSASYSRNIQGDSYTKSIQSVK